MHVTDMATLDEIIDNLRDGEQKYGTEAHQIAVNLLKLLDCNNHCQREFSTKCTDRVRASQIVFSI